LHKREVLVGAARSGSSQLRRPAGGSDWFTDRFTDRLTQYNEIDNPRQC
jgi:hypothetical protein